VLTTEIVPSADAAAPAAFAGTFTAKDSGEVFLFVNDAVIGVAQADEHFLCQQRRRGESDDPASPLVRLPKPRLKIVSTCLRR
jgi:hypothetical protein